MKRLHTYLNMILAAAASLAMFALCACEDRFEYHDGEIPEGTSTVDVSLGFKAFTPALSARASGTAMKNIDRLWLVIYDKDGKFVKKQEVTDFSREQTDSNTRPDGKPSSESKTGHVSFKLTLDNGYYRIYAVANHDLTSTPEADINTPAKLKMLDLTWQDGDVKQNAQMFGWFVNGDKNSDHGTDAPVVTIRDNSSSQIGRAHV